MFSPQRRSSSKFLSHTRLPLSPLDVERKFPTWNGRWRRVTYTHRFRIIAVVVLFALLVFAYSRIDEEDLFIFKTLRRGEQERPPLYEKYAEQESRPIQRDPMHPPLDNNNIKYIFHRNHQWRTGWGNVLQEMLFNSMLAQATGRIFVFDDYVWRRNRKYAVYNGRIIPARIPTSALLSGPIVGDTHEGNQAMAISRRYYEPKCGRPTRLSNAELSRVFVPPGYSGLTHLTTWAEKVKTIKAPCFEFGQDARTIFDFMLFGSKNILDVWPTYLSNPIVTNFTYSPLVLSAFQNNAHLLFSSDSRPSPIPRMTDSEIISAISRGNISRLQNPPTANDITLPALKFTPPPPIPGLLAVHLRRGDYEEHCRNLRNWGSTFTGFNSFPSLPDNWHEPSNLHATEYYARRCFPNIADVLVKVRRVRADHVAAGNPRLRRMYIMSNGKKEWLDELKTILYAAFGQGTPDGWDVDGIVTSRDMEWSWEQKPVSQATDMYIGQRAEVFIGNGFSSLTGHVVTMRMANGKPPNSTRHW